MARGYALSIPRRQGSPDLLIAPTVDAASVACQRRFAAGGARRTRARDARRGRLETSQPAVRLALRAGTEMLVATSRLGASSLSSCCAAPREIARSGGIRSGGSRWPMPDSRQLSTMASRRARHPPRRSDVRPDVMPWYAITAVIDVVVAGSGLSFCLARGGGWSVRRAQSQLRIDSGGRGGAFAKRAGRGATAWRRQAVTQSRSGLARA